MKTITTLEEVTNLVNSQTVYVRWTKTNKPLPKDGHSRNHATGAIEAGVSVNQINPDYIADDLTEYRGSCGWYCWIVTGDEISRGSDNEPVIANVRVIAKVSEKVSDEAAAISRAAQDARFAKMGWTFTQ